jgi:transcriptional regulator with XRE-family HTH domain
MSLEHWMPKLNPALFEPLRAMSEPDPKTTLREFQEYLDLSYESPREFAACIGVAKETVWYWLSGRRQPKAMSLAKLRRFLDNEAKRPAPVCCLCFVVFTMFTEGSDLFAGNFRLQVL